jgi:hypothetical protein
MYIHAVQECNDDEECRSYVVAVLVNGGAALLVGMAATRHWPDIDAGMCAALIWGGLTTFVGPLMQLDRQSEWANA